VQSVTAHKGTPKQRGGRIYIRNIYSGLLCIKCLGQQSSILIPFVLVGKSMRRETQEKDLLYVHILRARLKKSSLLKKVEKIYNAENGIEDRYKEGDSRMTN
jgi:hypothetical protein